MIEEVRDRLYRIEVPLPNSPLKELNSYVIKADDRNLIIDTGFNRSVCLRPCRKGFPLSISIFSKTDFMITHMHADHTGLISAAGYEDQHHLLQQNRCQVFDKDNNWQALIDYAVINGFPADELMKVLHNHPGYKYSPKTIPDFHLIDDGNIIEMGDYNLKCISTPGHTEGHICLYDEDKRILFSGDHILFD